MPARDGDDVLARAAQLDADDVGVGVDAEERRHEDVLEQLADAGFVRSDHGGRRDALADLLGMVWARETGDALLVAEHVGENLGHEQVRPALDTLGEDDDGHVGAQKRLHVLGGLAHADGRGDHDDRLGAVQRLLEVGRRDHVVREHDIRQVDRVAVFGVDALSDLGSHATTDETSCPLPPSSQLTAVPHEPAPMTAMRIRCHPSSLVLLTLAR